MRAFQIWWNKICEYCHNLSGQFDKKDGEWTWRAALEWYQSVAAECEKDCQTNEDYKILYFHLKQVLENETKK